MRCPSPSTSRAQRGHLGRVRLHSPMARCSTVLRYVPNISVSLLRPTGLTTFVALLRIEGHRFVRVCLWVYEFQRSAGGIRAQLTNVISKLPSFLTVHTRQPIPSLLHMQAYLSPSSSLVTVPLQMHAIAPLDTGKSSRRVAPIVYASQSSGGS